MRDESFYLGMPIQAGDGNLSPKMLRVPVKLKSREMLIGTIEKLEKIEHLLVVVEDDEGIWLMQLDGTTLERMNWMLDRAKRLIHE